MELAILLQDVSIRTDIMSSFRNIESHNLFFL